MQNSFPLTSGASLSDTAADALPRCKRLPESVTSLDTPSELPAPVPQHLEAVVNARLIAAAINQSRAGPAVPINWEGGRRLTRLSGCLPVRIGDRVWRELAARAGDDPQRTTGAAPCLMLT